MTRQELIHALAQYRRPGSPNYGRHFLRLPGEIVQEKHVPNLIDILWDDGLPPLVREHAAGALGEIGDERAVEFLIEALSETRLRRGAATALGRMKAQAAAPALQDLAPRVRAAQWALSQISTPESVDAIIDDLGSGQLRHIRPAIQKLGLQQARAVAAEICRQLREIVENHALDESHCWLLISLQYLPPSAAAEKVVTAAVPQIIYCGDAAAGLRHRLLRTLGAIRPLQAIPPLVDLVCQLDHPGHQHIAAVCIEKILNKHGDQGTALLHNSADRLRETLEDLQQQKASIRPIQPDKPWHHPPGSPGWFAEVERAIKALARLLQRCRRWLLARGREADDSPNHRSVYPALPEKHIKESSRR